ncbi:MAG: extracellular solute-binding protein [Gammaproteobacteria bacterium]|nr:extracellular solute-binding protein [Gammaproteobacteria bacterium]
MKSSLKHQLLAIVVSVLLVSPLSANTSIDWLHIEAVPATVELMVQAAEEYEVLNPEVSINIQFLENEAYKAKLTTLLQSDAAPDIFYSWGGGVMSAQQQAGVLRSIDDVVNEDTRRSIGYGGINAFTRAEKLFGLAQEVSQVGFWANKNLLEQADVEAKEFETWSGLLGAVRKLKAAEITPIALGAQDKWPVHFYWSYLVMRLAGQDTFDAARAGVGEGFAAEPFVQAGELFLQLVELDPFQPGYLAADYTTAAGYFADGKAALHLMGDWDYAVAKNNSVSGNGLPDEQMLFINFPMVKQGAGAVSDTLGGINGWVFHKDAPDEAVEFMQWYLGTEIQKRFAAASEYIPIVAGSAEALGNPFMKTVSENVSNTRWHAIFFDQELGPEVGGVVNDVSLELSDKAISAKEAAELVKEAIDDTL